MKFPMIGLAACIVAFSATASNAGCVYAGELYSDGAERDGQMCSNGSWTGRVTATGGGSGGDSGGNGSGGGASSSNRKNPGGGNPMDRLPPEIQENQR